MIVLLVDTVPIEISERYDIMKTKIYNRYACMHICVCSKKSRWAAIPAVGHRKLLHNLLRVYALLAGAVTYGVLTAFALYLMIIAADKYLFL